MKYFRISSDTTARESATHAMTNTDAMRAYKTAVFAKLSERICFIN